MIRLRRPTDADLEHHARQHAGVQPTFVGPLAPRSGFRYVQRARTLRRGVELAEAREALRTWSAHRGANVRVRPVAEPAVGATVALGLRVAGCWVRAACRVVDVVDEADAYGFTYATLPGHPEQGAESFVVRSSGPGDLTFEIESVSRPATRLVRVCGPLPRGIQARVTERYLDLGGLGRS